MSSTRARARTCSPGRPASRAGSPAEPNPGAPARTIPPMTPSPTPTLRRLAPSGLGRAVRRLPLPAIRRDPDSGGAGGRRELEVVVATVVGMAAVVSGPPAAVVAVLLLAATVLGTLQLLSEVDSPEAE